MAAGFAADGLTQAVSSHRWLHTMDLPPGVVTPGLLDFRPMVAFLPWPEVRGKRCLDLCTRDGYFAFELEALGAAEVVAVDVADLQGASLGMGVDDEASAGSDLRFEIAASALRSNVEYHTLLLEDLTEARLGAFDVVVFGGAKIDLLNRSRVLRAISRVCHGKLLSVQPVDLLTSVISRRQPAFVSSDAFERGKTWMVSNSYGHRRLLTESGFEVERTSRAVPVPFGPSSPRPTMTLKVAIEAALQRLIRQRTDRPPGVAAAYSGILAQVPCATGRPPEGVAD